MGFWKKKSCLPMKAHTCRAEPGGREKALTHMCCQLCDHSITHIHRTPGYSPDFSVCEQGSPAMRRQGGETLSSVVLHFHKEMLPFTGLSKIQLK